MLLTSTPSAFFSLGLTPLLFRVLLSPHLSVYLPVPPALPFRNLVMAVLDAFVLALPDVQFRLTFQLETNISMIGWVINKQIDSQFICFLL